MSRMAHQCSSGFTRERFCFALGLIHGPIPEQGTPCWGRHGWDIDVAVCATSCLPCWRGSIHSEDLQVPSAPCPRKTYPSFTRQVPVLK